MINVLVVEDESELLEEWIEGLTHEGLAAAGFERADRALAEMEARLGKGHKFDVAVLDLKLENNPEPYISDRWALNRELRQRDPDLLVLFVTGVYQRELDRIIGLHEAHGYLLKGTLTPGILAAEIRALVRVKESQATPVGKVPDQDERPVFEFEHPEQMGEGKVFSYDSARLTLRDPSDIAVPRGTLRNSDYWLLELFLRKPNQLVLYESIPTDVVPRPRPVTFAGENREALIQAVSRIGRELNPHLSDGGTKFFANVSGKATSSMERCGCRRKNERSANPSHHIGRHNSVDVGGIVRS